MGAAALAVGSGAPHVPVLLSEVLEALQPVRGATLLDGTFGAGGYTGALLDAGAATVLAIDRDREALDMAQDWATAEPRLILVEGNFAELDEFAEDNLEAPLTGIVLDIGVSSMQLDQAARGFSFLRDGPLDMRMSSEGPTAADIVNTASEKRLADVIYLLGEDRAARRIARTIVRAREETGITGTLQFAEIVAGALPPARPGQNHPATRTFQALRIAVNDELGALVRALAAAEAALAPGGRLAVVSFHSLEDRIVKRYLQTASSDRAGGSRHQPDSALPPPRFDKPARPRRPGEAEVDANPRARSAILRSAVRTDAPPVRLDAAALGMPDLPSLDDLLAGGSR